MGSQTSQGARRSAFLAFKTLITKGSKTPVHTRGLLDAVSKAAFADGKLDLPSHVTSEALRHIQSRNKFHLGEKMSVNILCFPG